LITVSQQAQERIEAYFEEKPRTPVRIQVSDSSCCGQYLSIALDQIGRRITAMMFRGSRMLWLGIWTPN